jgi:sugar lactone lactonase YvrE
VRVGMGGEVLDTIEADRGCFACMLGGDDGRTLYIVANHYSGSGASDGIVLLQSVDVSHSGRP